MSRPALATHQDLEDRLGKTLSGVELTQALARLADASEIVRAYADRTWLNDDETELVDDVPAQIPGVVATMVERASLNPSGITAEAAGPYSRSFGADAAARLYMTRNEKMVIRAAVGRSQIGTITTTRGPLETAPLDDRWDTAPTYPENEYTSLTNLMGGP